MGPLRELLASDHRQTLEFFFIGLKDVSGTEVDQRELLYNASVLAHYAQVSTAASAEFPTPASLESVFDTFVVEPGQVFDAGMLETAGTHCLMMAGFFEDQARTATTSAGTPTSVPGSSSAPHSASRATPRPC